MIGYWAKMRLNTPEDRERYLKGVEVDVLGSERDEPGCIRFNLLQDRDDPDVYFFELYLDEAALEAHRHTPHIDVWRGVRDTVGDLEVAHIESVLPADRAYWGKMS